MMGLYCCCWKIFVIYLMIILMIRLRHYRLKERYGKELIQSGLMKNSFNPLIIHLILNEQISPWEKLSIVDNNFLLFEISNPSMITMILSDGYHHLDMIMIDQINQIEYYQGIEISTGSQSLLVTVFNNRNQPMRNLSVHLELVDHPHIYLDSRTNQFGQVTFSNLPKDQHVYIEAICAQTKHHVYAQIDTSIERNITMILNQMSLSYDEEYNPFDGGFYAV